MQRMQRKMGVFLPRTADDAQVAILVADFEAAEKMLDALIDAAKHWRDSWNDLLTRQSAMTADYMNLYSPIAGADNVEQPREKLERVHALKESYIELKNDMLEEIAMIEKKIIAPARDAKISVKVYTKVIKKRDEKKLDYERYKSRTDKLQDNTKRSDRENTALSKHQTDLTMATGAYEAADQHLKETLPGMTHATYSLLPHLLNAQILIQNTLLAQYYTVLHQFCGDHGLPAQAPEGDIIIQQFEADYTSMRLEIESGFQTLAKGNAVKEPMGASTKSKSYTGLNLRNGVQDRITSSRQKIPTISRPQQSALEPTTPESELEPPKVNLSSRPRIPSSNSYVRAPGGMSSPSNATALSPASSAPTTRSDYFIPAPQNAQVATRQPSAVSLASAKPISSIVGKKKPPPPPPPKKRIPSYQDQYVTAVYDYDGQGPGDLSFREGERIKIVKKTESKNDWWEGELRGQRGQFPANYCE